MKDKDLVDLVLSNLSRRFGNKQAVEIASLRIPRGEFFTFVGPSGCGKSTTLNLIAGLEEPSAGSVHLGERLLNGLPPHQRDVAFVFQNYALYPHRTVYENLAFPLEMARLPRETIRQRVEEVAATLGLTALAGKRPAQLSGGERQRVALGRAMVRQPQLFLFDEPLSNLDPPLRAQMRKELKRLHRKLGITFLYVTHDQEEALSLSDRIAVMRAGRIEQCGPPGAVYEQPANLFVASFFGSPPMNLLPAQTGPVGETSGLLVGEQRLPLAVAKALPAVPEGTAVTLGIRPEHVRVSRECSPEAWPAKVSLAEMHGAQSYVELAAAGVSLMAVVAGESGYRPGEEVWVRFTDNISLFDPNSGERLVVKSFAADGS